MAFETSQLNSIPTAARQALREAASPFASRQQAVRQIGTNCRIPNSFNSTNKQIMSRTPHRICDAVDGLQIVIPNWYTTSGAGENSPGAPCAVRASVEYPFGVITRLKFGGSDDGVIPDGQSLVSDVLALDIPKGALIFVRIWRSSSAGIMTAGAFGTAGVCAGMEARNTYGVTTPDLTAGGVVGMTNAAIFGGPCAIIGKTTRPSMGLVGTSRVSGYNDVMLGPYYDGGSLARSIGPDMAYINLSQSGEQMAGWIAGRTQRAKLVNDYCTAALMELGINEANVGAPTLASRRDTMLTYFTVPVFLTTMEPNTTSTDSWATTVNQTAFASNGNRVTENNARRAVPTGFAGCFDIADVVESARDSGLWKPGLTIDGVHQNVAGYAAVRDSGVLRSEWFA